MFETVKLIRKVSNLEDHLIGHPLRINQSLHMYHNIKNHHADPDSEFSDFAIKNSINRARITMDFKNFLFLFIQFFISYHKSKFYKVSNGSVDVEIRWEIASSYSEITLYL